MVTLCKNGTDIPVVRLIQPTTCSLFQDLYSAGGYLWHLSRYVCCYHYNVTLPLPTQYSYSWCLYLTGSRDWLSHPGHSLHTAPGYQDQDQETEAALWLINPVAAPCDQMCWWLVINVRSYMHLYWSKAPKPAQKISLVTSELRVWLNSPFLPPPWPVKQQSNLRPLWILTF